MRRAGRAVREGAGSARTGAMVVVREGAGSARTGAMVVVREGAGSARTGAMVLLVMLAVLGGCDDEDDAADAPLPPPVQRGAEYEKRVIRGWLLALGRDDYTGAADYFAHGALIDQGEPYRLRGPAAARIFNASLPCRADLAGVKDEPGARSLASFRLREGPGGPCSGIVKVRFTIRRGRFTEWRQLPEGPEGPESPDPVGPV
jgi:hypothetical protein